MSGIRCSRSPKNLKMKCHNMSEKLPRRWRKKVDICKIFTRCQNAVWQFATKKKSPFYERQKFTPTLFLFFKVKKNLILQRYRKSWRKLSWQRTNMGHMRNYWDVANAKLTKLGPFWRNCNRRRQRGRLGLRKITNSLVDGEMTFLTGPGSEIKHSVI